MIQYKFSRNINQEFSRTLKERVRTYFKDNQIGQKANSQMVRKTIFALSLYLGAYLIIILAGIDSIPLLFFLWICLGLSKALIGTSVMHDALHGSYSRRKSVNSLVGFSAWVIGVDAKIWKIQHNVLHHTFTNIEHADEDIAPSYMLRFSPHQPRRWFHYYQHIYAIFLYSLSTLVWVTIKDFIKLYQYRQKKLIKDDNLFYWFLLELGIRKLLYHFFFLLIPIYMLDIPAGLTVLMFISMHFTTGILLSLIFQTAHVMPTSDFIMQEDQQIDENWEVHQIFTTTNYAMDNKLISWLFGGLNFQVEHHLFPNICHVHYPHIAKIVQQTTTEFNLPYYAQKSFGGAILSHFRMLRNLGRYDTLTTTQGATLANV